MGSGRAGWRALAACMAAGMALAGCGGGASEGPGGGTQTGNAAAGSLAGSPDASAPDVGGTEATASSGSVGSPSSAGAVAGPANGRATIGPTGGGIELAGVGAIRLLPDTMPTAAAIELSRTTDPHIARIFEETGVMFGAEVKAPHEMHVLLGSEQPTGDAEVRLEVPPELRAKAGPRDEIRLFYLNVYDDGDERLETTELTSTRGRPGDPSITARVPKEAFQPRADGRFEGWFYLGLTPSAPLGAPSTKEPRSGVAPDPVLGEKQWGGPSVAGKLDQSHTCAGTFLMPPVDLRFAITSRFGPRRAPVPGASRGHLGLDFGVPIGTPVRAAAGGVVRIRRQVDGRGNYIGWGQYIVLHHEFGMGSTLYAHLRHGGAAVPEGARVAAGDLIGYSGNTGTSSGPHLHLEYAPAGSIFETDDKVDPEPCLAQMPGGSLVVRDNGSLHDDAFAVSLGGRTICRTRIGEANACSLGGLRAGTYRIAVSILTAPDGQGTFEVASQDPRIRVDGQKLVSGTVKLGESLEYDLVVGQ